MRYVVFTASKTGATVPNTGAFEKAPELNELQALVGGYIEQIGPTRSVVKGKAIQILGNEDAVSLGLAPTLAYPAVMTVGGFLLGPIVVLGLTAGGEVRDLTDKELDAITAPGSPPGTFAFFAANPAP